jgi:hypothetical protein
MKTTFESNYIHKTACLDSYAEGQTGEYQDSGYPHKIAAKSKTAFLQAFAEYVGVDVTDVQVDPCEDSPDRVEVQTLETSEGYPATSAQIERWKAGELELYACTYTVYVQLVTRTAANMTEGN